MRSFRQRSGERLRRGRPRSAMAGGRSDGGAKRAGRARSRRDPVGSPGADRGAHGREPVRPSRTSPADASVGWFDIRSSLARFDGRLHRPKDAILDRTDEGGEVRPAVTPPSIVRRDDGRASDGVAPPARDCPRTEAPGHFPLAPEAARQFRGSARRSCHRPLPGTTGYGDAGSWTEPAFRLDTSQPRRDRPRPSGPNPPDAVPRRARFALPAFLSMPGTLGLERTTAASDTGRALGRSNDDAPREDRARHGGAPGRSRTGRRDGGHVADEGPWGAGSPATASTGPRPPGPQARAGIRTACPRSSPVGSPGTDFA